MKNLTPIVIFLFSLASMTSQSACAGQLTAKPTTTKTEYTEQITAEPAAILLAKTASIGKVMVIDFSLSDLTDLPNPPEELARITYFNVAFKQRLAEEGVEIIPVNDKIKTIAASQSATYLFDHTDIAASLAEGSGADYIIIGVAMKPTYLFVYPRMLLVDIKTKRKAFTTYVQMEGSWLDKATTASSANNLANKVIAELKQLNLPTK